jgi:hypothetical protein
MTHITVRTDERVNKILKAAMKAKKVNRSQAIREIIMDAAPRYGVIVA